MELLRNLTAYLGRTSVLVISALKDLIDRFAKGAGDNRWDELVRKRMNHIVLRWETLFPLTWIPRHIKRHG